MPSEHCFVEVSDDDVAAFADMFALDLDSDNYIESFDTPVNYEFTLAHTYGQTQFITDLTEGYLAVASVVDVPTQFSGKHKTKSQKKNRDRNIKRPLADEILATANYYDNKNAFDLMDSLQPELLLLLDSHFIPPADVSIYDSSHQSNVARNHFLRSNPMAMPKLDKVYNALVKIDGIYLYVDPGGETLVEGNALDIFQYVVEMDRGRAKEVYDQLSKDENSKAKLFSRSNYAYLLKMFRYERSLAKSVDKMSKISQLKRSDADAPYYWFDDLHLDHLILHPSLPLQVKARYQHCAVEPLENFRTLPEGAAYVVDTTKGGIEGASANDWKLLGAILDSGMCAYVHVYLEERLVGQHMLLVNKPRPHNHTAVFYVDPTLEEFCLLEYEHLLEDIREANERRNSRLYGKFNTRRICPMPPHNLILDMLTYMTRLWAAADDVRVASAKRPKTPYVDDLYNELSHVFAQQDLPAYKTMTPTKGFYTMITKPLRAFVKPNISKKIQYNLIMTATEGKRARFLGEWWYVANQYTQPKVPYVVHGREERVYNNPLTYSV